MIKSESVTKISNALLIAQKKIGSAKKGSSNPFFHSKYADLGEVMSVCKDALNENGITVLQPVGMTESGVQYVETILLHESGEFISDRMKLDPPMRKVKGDVGQEAYMAPDPQAQGSAISYARRYSLQSILFIPAEDDDAEKTQGGFQRTTYNQPYRKPSYPAKPYSQPSPEKVNPDDIPF